MSRDFSLDALVLSAVEEARGHLWVVLLTGNSEIKRVTLFGGRKSRLRAVVSPWHTGKIWLYAQNEQNIKITDFDAHKLRAALRENLYKTHAASLVSELLIATRGAGGAPGCWQLVNGFLDGLNRVGEEETLPALFRFLWRFLDLLGLQPQIERCASCGARLFSGGELLESAAGEPVLFSAGEHGFVCRDCSSSFTGHHAPRGFDSVLTRDALVYLQAVTLLDARESRRISLDAAARDCLKQFLFSQITHAAGERLKTLDIALW